MGSVGVDSQLKIFGYRGRIKKQLSIFSIIFAAVGDRQNKKVFENVIACCERSGWLSLSPFFLHEPIAKIALDDF